MLHKLQMRSIFATLTVMLSMTAMSAYGQSNEGVINLVVGEVMTMPTPGDNKIVRVGIGNGKMFEVRVLEEEKKLVFIPQNPGRSNMILWTNDGKWKEYTVKILPSNIDNDIVSINAMLKGIKGVRAERAGDSILLLGTTLKSNIPRIKSIAESFPLVINTVKDEELEMKRMVYMRVQIVEMKKNLTENLGVQWDLSAAGPSVGLVTRSYGSSAFRPGIIPPGLPSGITSAGLGSGLNPVLALTSIVNSTVNLAVNSGEAYVLATPELSTRSGGKAEFLAGGQIPMTTPGANGGPATVTYKDYGIKLTIEPSADEFNNVSTVLNTEISSIDNANTVNGNPGFLTRKTSSEFNVQAGKTIVISGLVNSELSTAASKVPGLSEIPVLGALFKSNNFRAGRTDLVILVTPMVIDPSENAIKKVADIHERISNSSKDTGLILK